MEPVDTAQVDHNCQCDCCKKIGGPSTTQEICKSCGKEFIRYRAGSFDWEYKDCDKCQSKAYLKELEDNG